MGALELLSRLLKFGLSHLNKLSSTAKLIIIGGLAFLAKIYMQPIPQKITQLTFTDFFSPLNMLSLEWVKVYPNFIYARDKFTNLLQVNRSGIPSNLLLSELKYNQNNVDLAMLKSNLVVGKSQVSLLVMAFSFYFPSEYLQPLVIFFFLPQQTKNPQSQQMQSNSRTSLDWTLPKCPSNKRYNL